MLQALLRRNKTKPTGVTCQYCGWNGTPEQIYKSKVMNTDSSIYEIKCCPKCMRNGGLIIHEDHNK
jgi:hypothetical protein